MPAGKPMSTIINIHDAKTHLSRIVEDVAAGAEVVIAKAGRPMARLVPLESPAGRKALGQLQGRLVVPDDFNALLPPEVAASFEAG
jgi:prevent-host-death family protein